jgi:carboxylesterase
MSDDSLIIPGAEPFFFPGVPPGGPIGCLLLHGFTAMPDEMRWLGEYLAGQGHVVLGVRLAGHATHPADLARTRWTDWLISVEEGLAFLAGVTDQVFLIGQSLGGMIALVAAARCPVAGVIALSTPSGMGGKAPPLAVRLFFRLRPMIRKQTRPAEPALTERREAEYPAYPQFPARILREIDLLRGALYEELPHVRVPTLLIHSHADTSVSPDNMPRIYERLGSPDKQMLWLDGMEHSLVRDPQREVVFDAIESFVVHHARDTGSRAVVNAIEKEQNG